MDLPVIFTTAFIIGFSGAMVPGPLLTVAIGESFQLGFIAGPLLMLGHGLLEIALIFALAGGLSVFLTQTLVSHIIAIAGGIFLVYMGYGIAKDAYIGKFSFNLQQEDTGSESTVISESSAVAVGKRRMRVVAMGILVSLSNPYWTIWWATVGLAYITMSLNSGYTGLTVFFTGHILADFTWYSLVAAVVAGGRKFLSGGVYKGVLLVCGVFMIGLGGYFLYNGLFA
ncbi:MAG: LysE type translocator [Pelotomaculum sp. PtaB.Bin013]|uniref:LysE family translocator n=1 Tax=Pelotomaculum isophthalicicum JI TaxID=947010 RepID=A0A9X4H0P0_9FIRM|nr:LysE family transporter [Pelotomaculum isophthalicicum]MDF9409982.1 LysE family translocator [Pelotomaculum isophthalicicum JI]OPX92267.1 MAG: LysE type translocator [Pelotomaculum sp. PtaB.Bin013]